MRKSLFIALLLAACGDKDGPADTANSADTGSAEVDIDGDGFTSSQGDCDDADASANPGADEVCDGVDNDCDGDADEDDAIDATTWYADADGDAFGDPETSVIACEAPSGYTGDDTDCDDTDGTINPTWFESCDEVDEDCDGDVDESAIDAATWYADDDSDGYGDPLDTTDACDQPSGYLSDSSDCDDGASWVNPSADEYCDGSDTDEDCDGEVNEDDALDAHYWCPDLDVDGYGDTASSDCHYACEQPSGYEDGFGSGDCDDGDAAVNSGAIEVCDGVDNDCDSVVDDALTETFYADGDGDGYGDPDVSVEACETPSGYTDDSSDCDDADASTNPGADEVCDGVDNDCDGDADEDDAIDATTWYADADGDAFGDPETSTTACEAPSGYTGDDTDCDDTDGTINPTWFESCDEVDEDCDGDVDESAIDAATWYADDDSDGYGDPDDTLEACETPTGYVADGTDCDDDYWSVNPGETEACGDGIDNDCDGEADEDDAWDVSTWYVDADGDGHGDPYETTEACPDSDGGPPSGYSLFFTDCDDSDATTYLGAPEVCDGVDNDCDLQADEEGAEDEPIWYLDNDGDGYGDPYNTTTACDQPTGYVADDTDCEDLVAAISPGADEVCDHIDNDCDGASDEDDAIDATTWYADDDGDGWGDPDDSVVSCDPPSGYLVIGTDCDDGDAAVGPGSPEYCDDIDNDCDGDIDDDAIDASTWYADDDGDGYGDPENSAASCEQPSGYLSDSSDCDDSDATVNPDGVEIVFNGVDEDCDGDDGSELDLSAADAKYIGEAAGDAAGFSMSGVGDVDGDGLDDLLIGAHNEGTGGADAGAAYLVLGPVSGDLDLSGAEAKFIGEAGGDYAGEALSGAGDVDGDGFDDLLIGAWGESSNGTEAGAAYLVLGPVSGDLDLYYSDTKFLGEFNNDYAGTSVSGAGDVDGDGFDDFLIGAFGEDTGGSVAGATYLVFGAVSSGLIELHAADAKFIGEGGNDRLGYAMSAAGDVDGDGFGDLLLGAYGVDDGGSSAGASYLVFGPTSGEIDLADADMKFIGEGSFDYSGRSVSAGDADGDGRDDLFIGAWSEDAGGSGAGAGYLLLSPY